jgi:hypothetical protein
MASILSTCGSLKEAPASLIPAITEHAYEIRPRKDKRGVDLISDALPFGRFWYEQVTDAIEYDDAGNLIETREHAGDFKERCAVCSGQVRHAIKTAFSACSRRELVAKTVATK